VRNRGYNAGNYVYAEISKTFKSGTRLTAGGYDFTPNVVSVANRAGGQFGFEHPLNKKVTLAADWFTGKHSAGYFTPGVVFKAGPKVTGYAGYSIANQHASHGNHFFLLEVGIRRTSVCRCVGKRSLQKSTGHPSRNNDKLKRIGH
jgi:hypothetical protein